MKGLDALLATLAGRGNHVLHQFFRVLAVVVAVALMGLSFHIAAWQKQARAVRAVQVLNDVQEAWSTAWEAADRDLLAKYATASLAAIEAETVLAETRVRENESREAGVLYRQALALLSEARYKVHYHLLLRSRHSKKQLATIIEESLPSRQLGRWHKTIKPIQGSDWRILRYITKAKTLGKTKSGRFVTDLYTKKRLLFKPGLGIRKHGTIGAFWVKSKDSIWSDVRAKEKRIAEGLAQANVKRLAEYVYDFVGGYVPLRQIERNFGYYSDSPGILNWIEQGFGHENRASPNIAI